MGKVGQHSTSRKPTEIGKKKAMKKGSQKIVDKIECDYATFDISKKIVYNEDGKEGDTVRKNHAQGEEDDKEANRKKECPSYGGTDHQRSSSKLCKAGKNFLHAQKSLLHLQRK
eukprot:15347595-Ditylum_brightwellii.AAC.1